MTLRLDHIPSDLDHALRQRAQAEGKTVGQVAIEAMERGLASDRPTAGRSGGRDLSFMGGMDDETYRAIHEVRAESERVWPDGDR